MPALLHSPDMFTPESSPADLAELATLIDQLMLKEKKNIDKELQEKLDRFYVETGPYNKDRIVLLKRGGFMWEPIVKHWWATERTLLLKDRFIHIWPQYHLTDEDKENLRQATRAPPVKRVERSMSSISELGSDTLQYDAPDVKERQGRRMMTPRADRWYRRSQRE